MSFRSSALRLFLAGYLAILFIHLYKDWHEFNAATLIAFALGAAVALFAHSRTGAMLYALLCLHMAIEWVSHGMHHWQFTFSEGAFELTHLAFDVAFLYFLARIQWGGRYLAVFAGTLLGLSLLSLMAMSVPVGEMPSEQSASMGFIQFLLLGGIVGCAGFHLIYPFKIRTAS